MLSLSLFYARSRSRFRSIFCSHPRFSRALSIKESPSLKLYSLVQNFIKTYQNCGLYHGKGSTEGLLLTESIID
jgi:hypothetical protein